MSQRTGGFGSRRPSSSRERIEARSNRNPSTCISRHPVTQAVLDHPAHDRLIGIQRVAAAGVVGVTGLVLLEDVIDVVRQTAIAQRRPGLPAFRRVIEHDVEDDFEARAVKRLDHVPKFVEGRERVLLRAVRLMWREERNGGIAPVVRLARRAILRVELEHRQQLHRGDAQILEVGNLFDQSRIGTALLGRDTRAGMARKAPHMQLVNHGLGKGPLKRRSPSQSYRSGSATTLFIATAALSPGRAAAQRSYVPGTATASP